MEWRAYSRLLAAPTTDHTGDFGVDQAESDKVLLRTIFKIDVFISVFSQSQIYRLIWILTQVLA